MPQPLEDAIHQAEQFIVEGEQRCTRVLMLMARQAAHGWDTTHTEALLRHFDDSLACIHAYRRTLFRSQP